MPRWFGAVYLNHDKHNRHIQFVNKDKSMKKNNNIFHSGHVHIRVCWWFYKVV